jgi:hypothetical protein
VSRDSPDFAPAQNRDANLRKTLRQEPHTDASRLD